MSNNTYILGPNGELYHHGVKGMKWGVRKKQYTALDDGRGKNTAASRARDAESVYRDKKTQYKQAKKAYNKSFNKAYNRSFAAWSPIKKHREANDARWEDAINKADTANKAREEYRAAKKAATEAKQLARLEMKNVKAQYQKQYLEGRSATSKLFERAMGYDKMYADVKYESVYTRGQKFIEDTWEDAD